MSPHIPCPPSLLIFPGSLIDTMTLPAAFRWSQRRLNVMQIFVRLTLSDSCSIIYHQRVTLLSNYSLLLYFMLWHSLVAWCLLRRQFQDQWTIGLTPPPHQSPHLKPTSEFLKYWQTKGMATLFRCQTWYADSFLCMTNQYKRWCRKHSTESYSWPIVLWSLFHGYVHKPLSAIVQIVANYHLVSTHYYFVLVSPMNKLSLPGVILI